ncbi:MAG TPA: hypothetical protein VK832_07475 [Burkholderiaceae bacterium]|jgi:hypothetical protein|nr:hypothetical protein [Burkholderiaceae bacterium]
MDLNKLRSLVFEKTGIKIETNDPIFALVALNEAVLSECVEQHITNLQGAAEQLKEQTTHLIQAGDRVKGLLLQMGQTVEDPPVAGSVKAPPLEETTLPWRWIGAAAAISLCSASLVLGGQAALGYPRIPAPVVVAAPNAAPALTPEQTVLIQNGEKYAKMWPKLDAKTQEKIRALTQ